MNEIQVFWGVFFLVLGNILINIFVLNSNIKDRQALSNFVTMGKVMSEAYRQMAIKYNEVARGFNEFKRVTDKQAEFIEEIVVLLLDDPHLAGATLEWLTTARNRAVERSEADLEFPSTPQI